MRDELAVLGDPSLSLTQLIELQQIAETTSHPGLAQGDRLRQGAGEIGERITLSLPF
jgi:hypothetical protein